MADLPFQAVRAYDIGKVLGNAFSVIRARPVLFLVAPLVINAGVLLFSLATGGGFAPTPEDPFPAASPGLIAAYLVGGRILIFLYLWVQVVLMAATVDVLEGRRTGASELLRLGLGRILPYLGVSVLFGLMCGLGFLILIVPGVIIAIMFSAAAPAIVAERPGVFGAFTRSRFLTRGSRWRIFLTFLVLYAIIIAVGLALGAVTIVASATATAVVDFLANTLSVLLMSTFTAASYVELRDIKEGPRVEQLAEIFA